MKKRLIWENERFYFFSLVDGIIIEWNLYSENESI